MPTEPAPGHRHYPDEIVAALVAKFDPKGEAKALVSYYQDAANNQLYINAKRLQSMGLTLKDLATFLEGQEYFAAVFTEDEVIAAQQRLPQMTPTSR
jgi:hypothetical protein